MKLFIIALFTVLLTIAMRMGDPYAMGLSFLGFLIMFKFVEDLENEIH